MMQACFCCYSGARLRLKHDHAKARRKRYGKKGKSLGNTGVFSPVPKPERSGKTELEIELEIEIETETEYDCAINES